jgi:hypothetical protein
MLKVAAFVKQQDTLAPDSKINLTATIDKELTPGEYLEILYLKLTLDTMKNYK